MIANTSIIFYGGLAIAAALIMRSKLKAKASIQPTTEHDAIDDLLDTLQEGVVEGSKRLLGEPVILRTDEQGSDITAQTATDADASHASEAPRQATPTFDPQHRLINIYIAAKPGESFVGYELLQTLLSAGLRFGVMNIFHYADPDHSDKSVFSLACAQEPGTFDLERIGGFSCRGLCLFYQGSADDTTRWDTMLRVAGQIADELNGLVLDDNRNPLAVPADLALFDE